MPAIAADTLIACPSGPRAAHSIMPGDHVVTLSGPRRVVWTGMRNLRGAELREAPSLGPITLRLGVLGQAADLRAAPHTRVAAAPGGLDHAVELARAGHGEAMPTVACAYVSIMFEETERVRANGVWIECLRPDEAPSPELAASRNQLFRLFPSLARRVPLARVLSPRIG